jgi:hypothetical protein
MKRFISNLNEGGKKQCLETVTAAGLSLSCSSAVADSAVTTTADADVATTALADATTAAVKQTSTLPLTHT